MASSTTYEAMYLLVLQLSGLLGPNALVSYRKGLPQTSFALFHHWLLVILVSYEMRVLTYNRLRELPFFIGFFSILFLHTACLEVSTIVPLLFLYKSCNNSNIDSKNRQS